MYAAAALAILVALGGYFFAKKAGLIGGPKAVRLSPQGYQDFKLIEKVDVIPPNVGCHTILFRFALPEGSYLDLPVGQHLSLRFTDADGSIVSRQYTPTTSADTIGHFDVVIKIYPTGKMGNYLKNLPVGSPVSVRGPLGSLKYLGGGSFNIAHRTAAGVTTLATKVHRIGMLAGGSGVTPMLQLVRYISSRPEDSTKMALILGNQTPGDIMCRTELEEAAERNSNFDLTLMVDRAPETEWPHGVGYITQALMKEKLPVPAPGTLILLCGPPPMMEAMKKNLAALGYSNEMIFTY